MNISGICSIFCVNWACIKLNCSWCCTHIWTRNFAVNITVALDGLPTYLIIASHIWSLLQVSDHCFACMIITSRLIIASGVWSLLQVSDHCFTCLIVASRVWSLLQVSEWYPVCKNSGCNSSQKLLSGMSLTLSNSWKICQLNRSWK